MNISNLSRSQNHLLWRAAFGPGSIRKHTTEDKSTPALWSLLKESLRLPVQKLTIPGIQEWDAQLEGILPLSSNQKPDPVKRKQIRELSRQGLKELNLLWFSEMINGDSPLREKISLFWHGHFACRLVNIHFQQDLLHTIRSASTGNFADLLKSVCKSSAMLQFLNNQQNRKSHPNENFARELMELFTLGRGNYSEEDIKEAARAFTGWGFDRNGQFIFREAIHDKGNKTIFGKTGNFNGDDVINLILARKETAQFITTKLFRFFVNEDPDPAIIEKLANAFYQSRYNISLLLDSIFNSDWFYDERNIGTQIKSPILLLAGIRRTIPIRMEHEEFMLLVQNILGQVLFLPPNVAGWPSGKNWIDSSTLMYRMQLPKLLTIAALPTIRMKYDDDLAMGMQGRNELVQNRINQLKSKQGEVQIEWEAVVAGYEKTARQELLKQLSNDLLQVHNSETINGIDKYIDQSNRASYIQSAIILLMRTPEYQLC